MGTLHIVLFGRFDASFEGSPLTTFEAAKMRELFCYLLLYRDRPQPREALASLLWGEHCTTSQSRKYLRKALWQLQSALNDQPIPDRGDLLKAEADWIQVCAGEGLWLDVAVFEAAYEQARGTAGPDLDARQAATLERAVDLYCGDLLEGWYQDWCLCERERFQQQYQTMLDKLMGYAMVQRRYEAGLYWGTRILQLDRAHERTHQQMMRLRYLAGDRTGALRQYTTCEAALREELDVRPGRRTTALYEQIRDDAVPEAVVPASDAAVTSDASLTAAPAARQVLRHLHQLQASLTLLHQRLQPLTHMGEALRPGPSPAPPVSPPSTGHDAPPERTLQEMHE